MGYTPPPLEVRKVAGGWSAFPPSLTTTETFTVYPNGVDTTPAFVLEGGANAAIKLGAGLTFNIFNNNTHTGYMYGDGTDFYVATVNNRNLILAPHGTGKVKFGVYDATPALASSGFIPIIDLAGNARKLMVQA